ncbi:hypothetical protein ROS217_14611 [Roseovarius sp. 217]|nr:hypothetical protein ROS217_14611 [Roseovarius sp. 217]
MYLPDPRVSVFAEDLGSGRDVITDIT